MSMYTTPWQQTVRDLEVMFRKWGVKTWDVERPYSGRKTFNLAPDQRRATVTWTDPHTEVPRELSHAAHATAAENLRPLFLALDAIRLNEVRGIGEIVAQTYRMLGSGEMASPHAVLGCRPDSTQDEIRSAYRSLAKTAHPDAGGDAATFARLTAAYDALREA